MRVAEIFVGGVKAGRLEEVLAQREYRFFYDEGYRGAPVSLTMPTSARVYEFDQFPPFFDGLLPEGMMLEALLKSAKIDRTDLFGQLLLVGEDLIGNVQVREAK